MIILSIDLGKTCGVSVWSTSQGVELTDEFKADTLSGLHEKAKLLMDLWEPDLVLIPYPTRFYRVIMSHSKMMGVIELEAEKRDIQVIECQDSTCKKVVIGSGRAKKPDILKHYQDSGLTKEIGTESEHILDSVMFIDWYNHETK